MLNDYLISVIRTLVPAAVAAGLTWLGIRLGVVLDADTSASLAVATTALVLAGYYSGIRALERRCPWFGVLLGHRQQPKYPEDD